MKKSVLVPFFALLLTSCKFTFTLSSSSKAADSGSPEIPSASFEESSSSGADESSLPSASSSPESSALPKDSDFAPEGYRLAWSDDFNGSSLFNQYWEYQIGNGNWGWGNGEAQYYTNHNDEVSNGTLKIYGKREHVQDGENAFEYTSTRIRTYHKVSTTYGYICARIKLSAVPGLWPAFWMLPEENFGTEGVTWWPTSGEIDIMENKGRSSTRTSGALHFASDGIGGNHTYRSREFIVDDTEEFHVYAVEWTADIIRWYVDGQPFFSVNKDLWSMGYGGGSQPFDRPFHIILNLAIAGQFDNYTDPPDDCQSSAMEVDYVRIYQAG